jgi:hypothetical protein
MRLTFLGPPSPPPLEHQPPIRGQSDWEREYASRSEPIEQPIKARWMQVAAGIGVQVLIQWIGLWIIWQTHRDLPTQTVTPAVTIYAMGLVLGLFILSALVGGGIAGAWCVKWQQQGAAVGILGVALEWLAFVLLAPDQLLELTSSPVFVSVRSIQAAAMVLLTTVGALLGSMLIRPIRVPLDPTP